MHQKGKSGSQAEVTREEVKKCVATRANRKAAGADQIVNGFMKYGGKGISTVMGMLYHWIWKNQYQVHTYEMERRRSSQVI